VQDVYQGPGLAGVKRGVVKTLRVVALEYRAAHAFDGKNGGNAHERGGSGFSSRVTTPVAAGNGTWEVKHILGEVPVEADGSVYFEAPARTSLYFQLLDERGYVVQTMRSWTTLQPGETFGCVGCHEYNTAPAARAGVPIALRKAPRRLAPTAYTHGGISNADSYLGVNRPKGFDKPAGFSFPLQVQPVLDKHCVSCHDGAGTGKGDLVNGIKKAKLDLSARLGDVAGRQNEHPWRNNGRAYSTAYLNLTNYGMPGKFTDWVDAEGVPLPLPAYLNGSSKSKLMRFLEPTHNSVRLSTEEKRLVAAWIDLGVPFCGSYTEANLWDQNLKTRYTYFEGKRAKYAEVELASLRAYLNEKK
ncbi:MAG: hypothetical protein LBT53_02910, partial [Puniceicoccales bacterium]|jgi:hypothetical protein|nr:hypothetical protein [Puniceicoccales bacterium]